MFELHLLLLLLLLLLLFSTLFTVFILKMIDFLDQIVFVIVADFSLTDGMLMTNILPNN